MIVTFVGIHLLTRLAISIGISLTLAVLDSMRGNLLLSARDVGPSAGYYGCLGFAVAMESQWSRGIAAFIMVVLLASLLCSMYHLPGHGHVLSADLAHATAFPLGTIWAWRLMRKNEDTLCANVNNMSADSLDEF